MQKLQGFWADSRGKVIAVLLLLWLGSLHVVAPIPALLGMLLSDAMVSRHITLSTIVTGLLIGLIFNPTAGIIPIITACFLASLSKNIIRIGPHNHVFNPAAFGIIAASLLFNRPVSWWGASWGIVPVIVLAIGMTPVLWKLKRFFMPVTFLAVYFLVTRSFPLLFDGTVFLFAFIMLPEIKTSPGIGFWQYVWGVLVGGLVALGTIFQISFTDPLLLALLVANLVGFILTKKN